DGVITLDVIDDVKPMGICGSGLIDAIACMLKSGLINSAGRLLDQETAAKKQVHPRLVDKLCKHQGMPAFILWEGETGEQVLITQKDIREVQLGKGAIFSGIKIMLQIVGKTLADVEKIYLAGAFGNYIKKESALVIGLMPNIGVDDIISIGNSAGAGASMALLSQEECQRIISKVQSIDHVELAEFAGFQDEFMRAMAFPK
ncbi:MAG: ASKHA domain-containing protein, partial [Clostridiales bacterium]